jgi:hypothetical protein
MSLAWSHPAAIGQGNRTHHHSLTDQELEA